MMEEKESTYCRGCMSKNAKHKITDEIDYLKTKFYELTTLMVENGFLCDDCLDTVNYIHTFRMQCLNIDEELKEIASQSNKSSTSPHKYLKSDHSIQSKAIVKPDQIKKEIISEEQTDEDYYVVIVDEKNNYKKVNIKHEEINIATNAKLQQNKETKLQKKSSIAEETSEYSMPSIITELVHSSPKKEVNLIQVLSKGEEDHDQEIIEYNDDVVTFDNLNDEIAVAEDGVAYTQEEIVISNGDEFLNSAPGEFMILEEDDDSITVMQQQNGSFLCDCGQCFMDFETYKTHKESHAIHTCEICMKKFEYHEVLVGHMLLHSQNDSQIACPYCKQVYLRNTLITHIKMKHCSKVSEKKSRKSYECEVCSKRFNTRSSLSNHSSVHWDAKLLNCYNCEMSFASEDELKLHQEQDCDPDEPRGKHSCNVCSKEYTSSGSLKRHMDAAHSTEENKLLCSECGEILPSQKAMHSHSHVHKQGKTKKMKKYICRICDKGCPSNAMLLMHERVHTGERPYKCDKCSMAFKTKTHLSTHQLTHSQVKQYGCSVCMKFFALKGNLIVHARTHTGEKPYVCDICDHAFIDSKYLKKHKIKRHGFPSTK